MDDGFMDEYVVSVEYRGFVHHEGVSIDRAIPGGDVRSGAVRRAAMIALIQVQRRADEHKEAVRLARAHLAIPS